MRMRFALIVALLLSAGARPRPVEGQAAASWFGTWTYNAAKSTAGAGPIPFKRATCRIEPWEDGVKVTYDLVRVRGGITHLEWTGRIDGADYPVQGVEVVVTNAYRRIDDRTYEIVQKVDGEVSATARMTVSPDGRTLTTVTSGQSGPTSTTVFDRK